MSIVTCSFDFIGKYCVFAISRLHVFLFWFVGISVEIYFTPRTLDQIGAMLGIRLQSGFKYACQVERVVDPFRKHYKSYLDTYGHCEKTKGSIGLYINGYVRPLQVCVTEATLKLVDIIKSYLCKLFFIGELFIIHSRLHFMHFTAREEQIGLAMIVKSIWFILLVDS